MLLEMLIYVTIASVFVKLYAKLSLVDTIKLCAVVYIGWLLLVVIMCL